LRGRLRDVRIVPDWAKAARVMQAMMQMVKLDFAPTERARDGK
jgi:hypothetical protein